MTKVFVKPNEQNRACFNFAMARKLRMKSKMEKKAVINQEQSVLAHFAERKQSRPKVKVA